MSASRTLQYWVPRLGAAAAVAVVWALLDRDESKQPEPSSSQTTSSNIFWHRGVIVRLTELPDGRWRWDVVAVPLGFNASNVAFTGSGEDESRQAAIESVKLSIDAVI